MNKVTRQAKQTTQIAHQAPSLTNSIKANQR